MDHPVQPLAHPDTHPPISCLNAPKEGDAITSPGHWFHCPAAPTIRTFVLGFALLKLKPIENCSPFPSVPFSPDRTYQVLSTCPEEIRNAEPGVAQKPFHLNLSPFLFPKSSRPLLTKNKLNSPNPNPDPTEQKALEVHEGQSELCYHC